MDKAKLSQVKSFMKQQLGALDDIDEVLKGADPDTDITDAATFVATQRSACNILLAIIAKLEPNAPDAPVVKASEMQKPKEVFPKEDKPKKPNKLKPTPPINDAPDLFSMMGDDSEPDPDPVDEKEEEGDEE